jgi:hypothetical protein
MVKQEVIEQSMSPWNSNPVLVRKSDGSLRFCIDFRGLLYVPLNWSSQYHLLILRKSFGTLPKDLYTIFVGFHLSNLCPFHRHSQKGGNFTLTY